METSGYGQGDRLGYLGRVAEASTPGEILDTVRAYLGAWRAEEVLRLQAHDAGWGPFDAAQQSLPVATPVQLRYIRDKVHGQCLALREAGLPLSGELAELEAFFFVAGYRLESLLSGSSQHTPRQLLALAA